ncbi:MAG TPA: DUF3999 family protein [Candidatus Sulfotelmatobacter sp.]|nr:DUF3999 family protein [Candidatus Sulfotelmatobacter sp.]
MKLLTLLALLMLFAEPSRPQQAIPYFTNTREVHIVEPGKQNYFVVDEEIWNHARPDLGDLRLYDGESPVQYALSEQRDGITSEEVEAKILNLGAVSGHTEFDLDTQGLAEYDRLRLRLDAHDFVATASVSGSDAPGQATRVELPPSTLYDFSKEQLGSNSLLKLPPSSFRYLHVKLSAGVLPQQVKGVTLYNQHEQKASWTKIGMCAAPEQRQRLTVITCTVPERVPLARVDLQIPSSQVNFRRIVTIEDSKGQQVSSGEISRVRVNRAGTLITNEQLSLNATSTASQLTINVDNGDNPPLTITSAQPLALERRIYFDPQGKSALRLYYGDEKLSAPVYDYARFFRVDPLPAEAQLEPGSQNPQYAGRPDERPWSERHTTVLWAAMLVAVLGLAALALRGLRNPTPS